MSEKTEALLVGLLCIFVTIVLFICSPARLEGEMNPLSFAFCCLPLIVSLPCWVIASGEDKGNKK